MKLVKLCILALDLSLISCSKDEPAILEDADLGFSVTQQLEYRGVLSTNDGKTQGKVFIEIPKGRTPVATIKLSTGDQLFVKGNYEGSTKEELIIHFESNRVQFDLNVVNEPLEALIENAVVDNKTTSIIAFKHTTRALVAPIDGTYECTVCGGSTFLNQGQQQTFNFVFVSDPSGNTNITTQVDLGTTMYTGGIGVQDNCVDSGDFRTCDIESGDGSTTTTGFMANGNPVTWTGTHTFNNLPTDPLTDCSGVSGTWQWQSISFGLITGTFESNENCAVELIFEDFEDATLTYTGTPDDIVDIANKNYFGRNAPDTAFPPSDVEYLNIQGNGYYSAQDTDDVPGFFKAPNLNWNNIDISGLNSLDLSIMIAEDDASDGNEDWDTTSAVLVTYRLDGSTDNFLWIQSELGVDGNETNEAPRQDINFDTVGDGMEVTATFSEFTASINTGGASTLDIIISILNLNAGDEDVAIDNVRVTGNY